MGSFVHSAIQRAIKPFAWVIIISYSKQTAPGFLSDVCEVSEERKVKETKPVVQDKMMQVFVKRGT